MELSKERQNQLNFLAPLVDDILSTNIDEYISNIEVEMKMERGQGKRAKGMVKGGMGCWYGTEKRTKIDFSLYSKDMTNAQKGLLKEHNNSKMFLYLQARKYGLNNDMAFAFAMFKYLGKI